MGYLEGKEAMIFEAVALVVLAIFAAICHLIGGILLMSAIREAYHEEYGIAVSNMLLFIPVLVIGVSMVIALLAVVRQLGM